MNANDVIDSYVTDVAVRLPRKLRNDVAFELRALLQEGLQDKADAAGRGADAAMALDLVRAFGRPEDVAARYRPSLTIIDPADGHSFLRLATVGLAIIWGLGLWEHLSQPISSGSDLIRALSQWWGGTVLPSPWWPGVLVIGFGLASWARRRRPQTSEWKPRASDHLQGGRTAQAMALVGILCGIYFLLDPRRVLDLFWGGRAAPVAYQALTYTDAFLGRQAPFLLVLLLSNIPLFLAAIVSGRGSVLLRRLGLALGLVTYAVMVWTVLDGPIFLASSSDRVAKFCLVVILAFSLLGLVLKLRRSVKPKPSYQTEA